MAKARWSIWAIPGCTTSTSGRAITGVGNWICLELSSGNEGTAAWLRRETSRDYGCPVEYLTFESRVSRTFCVSPMCVKGFCRNAAPFRMPSFKTTSRVWPDHEQDFQARQRLDGVFG